MKRATKFFPALLAFGVTVLALLPSALSLPQHGDERIYVWISDYYWQKFISANFSQRGERENPGWGLNYWTRNHTTPTLFIYGLVMDLTGSPPPPHRFRWGNPNQQGPETEIPQPTLQVTRITAVLLAALGTAFISLRFQWWGLLAILGFLTIPHVRNDLALAWAEGPLLFGFGLCALAYGSRGFALACGLAASFKLTALGLWPLLLVPGANSRHKIFYVLGLPVAALVWALVNVFSWFHGGPLHLIIMLSARAELFTRQSAEYPSSFFGLFLPSRYLWPLELVVLLVLSWLVWTRVLSHYIPRGKN